MIMKKLFYLFLLPLAFLASCDDNDDISPVDMTLTLSGVTQVNDSFYAVAGDEVTIDGISVKAVDGKDTTVANVSYSLDGYLFTGTMMEPFNGTFSTENLSAGTHTIGVEGNLLQVDAAIQVFAATYSLTIVESEDDLPEGYPAFGTYSETLSLNK